MGKSFPFSGIWRMGNGGFGMGMGGGKVNCGGWGFCIDRMEKLFFSVFVEIKKSLKKISKSNSVNKKINLKYET